jgi:hypothetical protein
MLFWLKENKTEITKFLVQPKDNHKSYLLKYRKHEKQVRAPTVLSAVIWVPTELEDS